MRQRLQVWYDIQTSFFMPTINEVHVLQTEIALPLEK